MAVCPDSHVSLAVRAADPRPGLSDSLYGDPVCDDRRRVLEADHEVLDEAVRRQLRNGSGDRYHPRVRVRNQLEQLLVVRGRHFRRPAGHRGYLCIFHGEYFLRRDVFRLEQGEQEGPSGVHLAHGHRYEPFRRMDSDSQRMDAVSHRHGVQSPTHGCSIP